MPPDWKSERNFDRCVRSLDKTSSPGWPHCREAGTIGAWLYPGNTFEPDPAKRSMLLSQVMEVFNGEYDHIFKVFVKPEAHKPEKAAEGRWRLIIASSLPVQVAWAMTVGHLEESLLTNQPNIPPAYNTCFFGGGWRRFAERCRKTQINWATDKSAWDWNSPGWVYRIIQQLRVRLTANATEEWKACLGRLYDDAYFESKVMLATGHIYKQVGGGLMKSGLLVTLSDNSLGQVVEDALAQLSVGQLPTPMFATGDDVLQRKPHDTTAYLERLQRFGCKVKQSSDSLEFMGFDFTDQPMPLYPAKHIWNLLRQTEDKLESVLDAYCRMYAKQPEFQKFYQRVADYLGVRVRSPQYYEFFMDNPDALISHTAGKPRYVDAESA